MYNVKIYPYIPYIPYIPFLAILSSGTLFFSSMRQFFTKKQQKLHPLRRHQYHGPQWEAYHSIIIVTFINFSLNGVSQYMFVKLYAYTKKN